MGEHVFPSTREGKASAFSIAVPHVDANSTRLGLSALRVTALKNLYGDATTVDTYVYYFTLWKSPATRTPVITLKLDHSEAAMMKMLSGIYNDIPASIWTDDDRKVLNRKTGMRKDPTKPTNPISEKCSALTKTLGGGAVKIKCRSNEDSNRGSKPIGCDAVEIAYRKYPPVIEKNADGSELAGKTRVQLKSPDDGTTKVIFTKATFVLKFSMEDTGNNLQFYVRWINTKHPELNGLWSGPYSEMIS
jgi:hypothetical protein